nr:signal peptidase I [Kordiimonas marina]
MGTAVIIYVVLTFNSYRILSGSMEPTLEVGDRLVTDRFAYRMDGTDAAQKPQRGDIIVFTLRNTPYLKRVEGLPGDSLQLKDGRLYINGTLVQRDYVRDLDYIDYRGAPQHVKLYRETLPGGRSYPIYEHTDQGRADNTPLYIVPNGHYFVLGDNRDNSLDSRFLTHMGFIKSNEIGGKARFITFSLYDCTPRRGAACPGGTAFSRFFTRLQ